MKLFCDYIKEFTPKIDKMELSNNINSILSESILFIDNKDKIISNIVNIVESVNVTGRIYEGIESTPNLSDEELIRIHEEIRNKLSEELKKDPEISKLEEGIFGKIIGGATGFLAGPMIGKIIARALGIEKGILFDFLSSRLVSAGIGAAIGNNIGK